MRDSPLNPLHKTISLQNISNLIVQNEGSGNLLQYRPGDILIAGLMRVHRRGHEACSDIQEDGVQAVETMNMIIDKVKGKYNSRILT